MSEMRTPLIARKLHLEQRLGDLGALLGAIDDELDSHHNPDWEELAIEHEGDQMLETSGLVRLTEIRHIRSALARIHMGSYGRCTRCDGDITEARLDALPWTPLCRNCAR